MAFQKQYGILTKLTSIMADIFTYKCKKCGWCVNASPNGVGVLMSGDGIEYFVCPKCKKVVTLSFSDDTPTNRILKCPICGCENIFMWKPEDFCPKCGGELHNEGLYCIMD
jgi:ferredoxin